MRDRHSKITLGQPEANAAVRHQCTDTVKVEKYFLVLKGLLEENNLKNKTHTIWNMDETGMQLEQKPGKIVAETGSKYLNSRETSGN